MQNKARGKRLAGLAGLTVIMILASMAWGSRDKFRQWHQLFKHFDRLGHNAQGYPEYRHAETGVVFVLLSGGEFMMGSRESEDSSWDERPSHLVRLSPFLIAKYEVSQREWPGRAQSPISGENLPVCDTSWGDCQIFCEKSGFRLPSEAQWEYAARGRALADSGRTHPLSAVAWYGGGASGSRPVGQKEPNTFGLYDMYGNVWEWCEDVYNEMFYSRPEANELNPVCSTGLVLHVLRGGSWQSPAAWCRAGYRGTGNMSASKDQCGLRPVWVFP